MLDIIISILTRMSNQAFMRENRFWAPLGEVDPQLLAMGVIRLKNIYLRATQLSTVQVTAIFTTLLATEEHRLEELCLGLLPGDVDLGLVSAVKEKVKLLYSL